MNSAIIDRINIARKIALSLACDSNVLAVLVSGSVARNRCSANSDLDLIIITEVSVKDDFAVEIQYVGFIRVELDWISKAAALEILTRNNPSLKELREAARLGTSMPIWDPLGISDSFSEKSGALLPAREFIQTKLKAILDTFIVLFENRDLEPLTQWEIMRCIYDNAALISLTLHPLRYQKQKWVIRDLTDISEQDMLRGLLDAYFIHDNSHKSAHKTINAARIFLEEVGRIFGYVGYEDIVRSGYSPDYAEYSYACSCLSDACDLLSSSLFQDAIYTAKFATCIGVALCKRTSSVSKVGITTPQDILITLNSGKLVSLYEATSIIGWKKHRPDDDVLSQCLRAIKKCKEKYKLKFKI